jgi:hypothetical protein
MANFGQRPFEFDIDGYMRVRFLLFLSRLPGSLLLFFYAYVGFGESTAPKSAAGEVSKSWETPSEAASACCDCRCSYTQISFTTQALSPEHHCLASYPRTTSCFCALPLRRRHLHSYGIVATTKKAASCSSVIANPTSSRTETTGNDRRGNTPRRHVQTRTRPVGDRHHSAASKCSLKHLAHLRLTSTTGPPVPAT